MDFMKHISRAECATLDSLSNADRTALAKRIIAEQEYRSGLLTIKEFMQALNVSEKVARSLPINILPFNRPTPRGLRRVKCVHNNDVIAFLTALNPAFADYDPSEGPLLTPAQAAEKFGDNLPQSVSLSVRTCRYRSKLVGTLLAPSELLTEGL